MQVEELLKNLGYAGSANLLRPGQPEFDSAPASGHIFRLAASKRRLKGVYALRPPSGDSSEPIVPVVYICEAENEADADRTHRLVWNQSVVPFLLVTTPESVRLYSGFRYRRGPGHPIEGVLQTARTASQVLRITETLSAECIDDGGVWRSWGNGVRPDARVDWRLLESLQRLDQWLQGNGLEQESSHALIGKYVYLRYLRDRDILSDRKLASWGVSEQEIFGRHATLRGVERLVERLDDWLNGEVFPIRFSGRNSPRQEHLRRVAGTFKGDQPLEDRSWQLHLDFQAYDFSYIPIETLSVIYQQFLHSPVSNAGLSRGREAGAYYTPLPVVNFMLAEMEDRRPFRRGMRVLDNSCGSGAFLVQCYRRLIEREYPPSGHAPGPIELRRVLQEHIFGIDRDPDACSVTELSLILTLLDYVNPPDLENDKRVKLPSLRGANVFCEDSFEDRGAVRLLTARRKFEWVVGNPPWKKLNPKKLKKEDQQAWDWMVDQEKEGKPIGGHQTAQAFIWAAGECMEPTGQAGLLVPAMTLFEEPAARFRAAFLKDYQLQSVANFSNLAEVLFAGRSRVPAAALFFRPAPTDPEDFADQVVTTYAPLVANQEPTRPVAENSRQETWTLVLNASEVRDIPLAKIASGSGLPWKIAAWGSDLDERLLRRLATKFPSVAKLEERGLLTVSQGLELRRRNETAEEIESVSEVIGKSELDVDQLREMRHLFTFPENALKKTIASERAFSRKGRADLPLSVCRPPHIIVSAARNFAIYSDEFIVVPPRQIGIASPSVDKNFLIAISLYLSSDFAFYHQFLTSSQFGVQRGLATLRSLRQMPIPANVLSQNGSKAWTNLHRRLLAAKPGRPKQPQPHLFSDKERSNEDEAHILDELNELVSQSLGLSELDRALVRDLVDIKLELNDGKLGRRAVEPPTDSDVERYARCLKSELDAFTEGEVPGSHKLAVLLDDKSGLIAIDFSRRGRGPGQVHVWRATDSEAAELRKIRNRLRVERSQWVYFDRNLRIFEGERTVILKPLQRFHWTVSQAVSDAADVIAERVNM